MWAGLPGRGGTPFEASHGGRLVALVNRQTIDRVLRRALFITSRKLQLPGYG